jgi:uncharacterized cysteine cluster protein YcgN (CxxCxxCC family)
MKLYRLSDEQLVSLYHAMLPESNTPNLLPMDYTIARLLILDILNDHEHLCRRCGQCCRGCAYLDATTHLCSVYATRHETQPDCGTIQTALRADVLAADCPYRELYAPKNRRSPR